MGLVLGLSQDPHRDVSSGWYDLRLHAIGQVVFLANTVRWSSCHMRPERFQRR